MALTASAASSIPSLLDRYWRLHLFCPSVFWTSHILCGMHRFLLFSFLGLLPLALIPSVFVDLSSKANQRLLVSAVCPDDHRTHHVLQQPIDCFITVIGQSAVHDRSVKADQALAVAKRAHSFQNHTSALVSSMVEAANSVNKTLLISFPAVRYEQDALVCEPDCLSVFSTRAADRSLLGTARRMLTSRSDISKQRISLMSMLNEMEREVYTAYVSLTEFEVVQAAGSGADRQVESAVRDLSYYYREASRCIHTARYLLRDTGLGLNIESLIAIKGYTGTRKSLALPNGLFGAPERMRSLAVLLTDGLSGAGCADIAVPA